MFFSFLAAKVHCINRGNFQSRHRDIPYTSPVAFVLCKSVKARSELGLSDEYVTLRIQKHAKNAETFAPNMVSLPAEQYETMVRKLGLPLGAIEGTTVVGPFFWTTYSDSGDDPRLRKLSFQAFLYCYSAADCDPSHCTRHHISEVGH